MGARLLHIRARISSLSSLQQCPHGRDTRHRNGRCAIAAYGRSHQKIGTPLLDNREPRFWDDEIKAMDVIVCWMDVATHYSKAPALENKLAVLRSRLIVNTTLWKVWWHFVKNGDAAAAIDGFANV